MTDFEIAMFLCKAFAIIRNYARRTYTRKTVIEFLINELSNKYTIENCNNGYIKTGNEVFKIYSYKDYASYDIKHVGKVKNNE